MNFNYDYQKKNKKNNIIYAIIIVCIALVISAFIFRNSNNTIVSKVSHVITIPFVYIGNFFSNIAGSFDNTFASKEEIIKENEELKNENIELKLANIQKEQVIDENEILKDMLKIKKKYNHYDLKYGKIIFKNFDNYNNKFTIDIGEVDGIKEYQAVIHEDGLVGYISNVSENTSIVTTILDPKTSVSVKISTINETAVLKGDVAYKSSNNLKLEYLPINSEISLGDILYTSGLGDMYYSSIPVAKIINIENNKNDSDRYATCTPIVNIGSIREVAIVIK